MTVRLSRYFPIAFWLFPAVLVAALILAFALDARGAHAAAAVIGLLCALWLVPMTFASRVVWRIDTDARQITIRRIFAPVERIVWRDVSSLKIDKDSRTGSVEVEIDHGRRRSHFRVTPAFRDIESLIREIEQRTKAVRYGKYRGLATPAVEVEDL
jgi:hypothetical protein